MAATQEENCGIYADLAEKVMEWRQSGADMQKLLVATGAEADPIMKSIILDAYGVRQFDTPEYRDQATAAFRNDMTLRCYQIGPRG